MKVGGIKVLKVNNYQYDVFTGDDWYNWTRVKILHSGQMVCEKGNQLPVALLQVIIPQRKEKDK